MLVFPFRNMHIQCTYEQINFSKILALKFVTMFYITLTADEIPVQTILIRLRRLDRRA